MSTVSNCFIILFFVLSCTHKLIKRETVIVKNDIKSKIITSTKKNELLEYAKVKCIDNFVKQKKCLVPDLSLIIKKVSMINNIPKYKINTLDRVISKYYPLIFSFRYMNPEIIKCLQLDFDKDFLKIIDKIRLNDENTLIKTEGEILKEVNSNVKSSPIFYGKDYYEKIKQQKNGDELIKKQNEVMEEYVGNIQENEALEFAKQLCIDQYLKTIKCNSDDISVSLSGIVQYGVLGINDYKLIRSLVKNYNPQVDWTVNNSIQLYKCLLINKDNDFKKLLNEAIKNIKKNTTFNSYNLKIK